MTAPIPDADRLRDYEAGVLGGLLAHPGLLPEAVAAGLTSRAFAAPSHAAVFRAMRAAPPEDFTTGPLAATMFALDRGGDTALAGGREAVARLLDVALQGGNVAVGMKHLRELERQREGVRLLREATARAEREPEHIAGVLADLAGAAGDLGSGEGASRFADAARNAADLATLPIEKPRSLLGDGVLVAGGLGVLYGKPGMSKTFLALLLDRAMARGEPWMGLATPPEGVRVGLLQLELGAYALQSRLRTLGIGEHERDSNLHVVCRPHLRGVVDLFRQPEDMRALCAWIDRNRLGMVGIDALSRAHTANENAADELGQVLAGLDAMRHETGCAILLVHHEPKERAGSRPDNHLDALRGTSRLQSDPTLLMRVWQSRGLRCLTFAKVSEGPTPADVFFRLGEGGRPEVTKSPESKADDNRARVLRVVLDAKRPITRAEVQEAVDLGRSAVAGHLKSLADEEFIGSVGEGTTLRYAAPTVRPSTASEHNGADGLMTLSDKHLESSPS